ncbi:hypothetical protein VTO73DRAFT_13679 [Trametes versicolor]
MSRSRALCSPPLWLASPSALEGFEPSTSKIDKRACAVSLLLSTTPWRALRCRQASKAFWPRAKWSYPLTMNGHGRPVLVEGDAGLVSPIVKKGSGPWAWPKRGSSEIWSLRPEARKARWQSAM